MADSPDKTTLLTTLLTHFETLADLESQYLTLRQNLTAALAHANPDRKPLSELKVLAYELRYQIEELKEEIAALEEELVK